MCGEIRLPEAVAAFENERVLQLALAVYAIKEPAEHIVALDVRWVQAEVCRLCFDLVFRDHHVPKGKTVEEVYFYCDSGGTSLASRLLPLVH